MRTDARRRAADLARRLAAVAFAAVVVLSPFRADIVLAARPVPPLYGGYTDLTVSWALVAVVALLVLWTTSLALDPRGVSLGPWFLRWPAAGLLILALTGVAWSIDPVLSLFNVAEIVCVAGLALYVLNEVDSLDRLALPLAVMVLAQGTVGIGQVLAQRSVGLSGLGELSLDPRLAGVSVVATSSVDRLLRAYGLTDHPNILGGLLAFALPLLAASIVIGRGRSSRVAAIAFAVGSVALFVTFSRAAWLGFVVAVLLALAMHLYRRDARTVRRLVMASTVAAVPVLLLLLGYGRYVVARTDLINPISATEAMSLGERSILVAATDAVFVAHPLGGTGLSTLPLALSRAGTTLTFDYQPASVVILAVAAELGVLAALCYGVLLLAPLVALWRRQRTWTPGLVAASAALVTCGLVGFFDYYTWTYAAGRIWSWLLLGLWARAYVDAGRNQSRA